MSESNLKSLVRKWKEARATVRMMQMGDFDPFEIRKAAEEFHQASEALAAYEP